MDFSHTAALVCLIVLALTALALLGLWTLSRGRERLLRCQVADLEYYLRDRDERLERQQKAARAVLPYVAQTSVAAFYNETNGVQTNFAQRQAIAARTQQQNAAVRAFHTTFGFGVLEQAGASRVPMTPEVVELGPDAKTPLSGFPWRLLPDDEPV